MCACASGTVAEKEMATTRCYYVFKSVFVLSCRMFLVPNILEETVFFFFILCACIYILVAWGPLMFCCTSWEMQPLVLTNSHFFYILTHSANPHYPSVLTQRFYSAGQEKALLLPTADKDTAPHLTRFHWTPLVAHCPHLLLYQSTALPIKQHKYFLRAPIALSFNLFCQNLVTKTLWDVPNGGRKD